jgi:hypothetical protein
MDTVEDLDQPTEATEEAQPIKHPAGNNRGLKQAYDLRDLAASEAVRLNGMALGERETASSRATSIAGLIKAWDIASDRLRIMRNRPLPGSLRPERPTPKRKAARTAPAVAKPVEQPSVVPAVAPTVTDNGQGVPGTG